ncbi:MAG TPA: chemotaxis protein CheW [Chthoniobacterales bacterium]
MLFILFQLGPARYAIPANRIVEVLPRLKLNGLWQVPAGISGLFNYRGAVVPVVDLSLMIRGEPAARRLSTRIILVEATQGERKRLLGLMAEHVTETMQFNAGAFSETGVASDGAPCLGRMANHEGNFIQRVAIEQLLTPGIRDALFRELVET